MKNIFFGMVIAFSHPMNFGWKQTWVRGFLLVLLSLNLSLPAARATSISVADDKDGDGEVSTVDCDDTDPEINSNAEEDCDEVDNNCDGEIDEDCPASGDGTSQVNGEDESDAGAASGGCSLRL